MATPAEHTPLGQLAGEYWVQSRRPLASLVFIAPLLAIYEAGVLLLGVQNGADTFMRRILDLLGFGQHFLLPMLTVCILLGWHYLSREPWRLSGGIISAMAVESLMLGICLRAISLVQNALVALEHRRKNQGRGRIPGRGNLRGTAVPPDPPSLAAWVLRPFGVHAAGEPGSGSGRQQSGVCRRASRGPLRREWPCTPSCFVLWRGSSFRSCSSIGDSASPRAAMPRTTFSSACWAKCSSTLRVPSLVFSIRLSIGRTAHGVCLLHWTAHGVCLLRCAVAKTQRLAVRYGEQTARPLLPGHAVR